MHTYFDDFTLLIDGKEAFPEILSCIQKAKKTIEINMFIWRDDHIGNAIAKAILDAACRNVKIFLSIDRVGAVLEYAEEYRSSFFHKKLNGKERVKAEGLRLLYPSLSTKRQAVDKDNILYQAIMTHPNIQAQIHTFKADHSKYYIFDEEILILGGINIEDKENGQDISGRIYQDYMVKLEGASYVTMLKEALNGKKFLPMGFCVNSKICYPHCFDIGTHYEELIRESRKELLIAMAYFAPPKRFLEEIVNAYERGVQVTLCLPAHGNFMNHASLQAAFRLMKRTDNGIRLYLTPKMMHTKLIANEKRISLGSANMMKNAFHTLSELNLYFERTEHPFCQHLLKSVQDHLSGCEKITHAKDLQYSSVFAWMEELFQ